MSLVTRAKRALWRKFEDANGGKLNGNGYVSAPEENLLPGLHFDAIKQDLQRGSGNELTTKFLAVHSSCALAVNSFGPFHEKPGELMLLGKRGATRVEFEWQLKIFEATTPANLDVCIEREGEIAGVESKLLEHLQPKRAIFSNVYETLRVTCEPCWWEAYVRARDGGEQFLDRAQLIKHYFALNRYRREHPQASVTLLYLFWEPLNWKDVQECCEHREELWAFCAGLSDSNIAFRWMTCNELWGQWGAVARLAEHARKLKERYQVAL